jgi:hypothetical protein
MGFVSFERGTPVWHTQDNHGQIPALAFWQKTLKPFQLFPY